MTPGATATWTLTVPKSGSYTLWVRYANADKNKAQATVAANGKPLAWKLNLNDYVGDGNWDHWFTSYVTVNLKTGLTKFTDSYDQFLQFKQEYQNYCDTESAGAC